MATFTDIANEWIKNNMSARVLEKVLEPQSHNPSAWDEDFHRWALDRCVWRDRCFGGIGALHADFSEWSVAREDVLCTRNHIRAPALRCRVVLRRGSGIRLYPPGRLKESYIGGKIKGMGRTGITPGVQLRHSEKRLGRQSNQQEPQLGIGGSNPFCDDRVDRP